MPSIDDALSQIAEIRSQLATSTRFRGFAPAPFAVTAGLFALTAAAQTYWQPFHPANGVEFVWIWGLVLIGVTLIVTVESFNRARFAHGQLADMLLGATVRRLAPFGLAIASVAFAICAYAPQSAWLVPGLWLMLMGLSGFSTAPSLPRAINAAALWYFLSGVVVLMVAGAREAASPWMLGVPLAVGHGWIAWIMRSLDEDAASRG